MTRADVTRLLTLMLGVACTAPAAAQTPAAEPSPSAASTPYPAPPSGTVAPFTAPARIPFVVTDPLPLVAVNVNGHDAFFFIDTGASSVVLDPAFAAETGVALADAGVGVFGGGKKAGFQRGTAAHLTIGPVSLADVPVIGISTRPMAFFGARRVDGIIGTSFLANFLATLDYVHGALILRPRSASAAFEASLPATAASVPIVVFGDHFIFARGRINDGPEGLLNVDTGLAGGGVMPSRATVADSHIVLDQAHAGQGMGAGGPVRIVPFSASVTLGTRRIDGVGGLYSPDGDQYGIFPFAVRGSVSHDYFRTCALTFDFDAMRLVMQ